MKVSVIVAVYNAEIYLRQCMDSIANQTLRDIEIICVNDGSTDSSPDILDEYAAEDNRIKVVTKENEGCGAASARNLGLELAQGEFLSILDSDDFFEPDMLRLMVERAYETDADIIICNGLEYDDINGNCNRVTHMLDTSYLPGKDVFSYKDCAIYQVSQGEAWNKLFRRSFIEKHNLRFQRIKYTDDAYFTFSHMALAGRIAVVDKYLVYYRVNTNSSQSDGITNYPDSSYMQHIALKKSLAEWGIFNDVKRSFVNCAAAFMRYCIDRVGTFEIYSYLHEKFRGEIFPALEISGNQKDYFNDERLYLWVSQVMQYDAGEMMFRAARVFEPRMTTAALRFKFPYELVKQDEKLVIYGAGLIGRHYLAQLLLNGYCRVVLWTEYDELEPNASPQETERHIKDKERFESYPARLPSPPKLILECDYDKIFIALANNKMKMRAKKQLLEIGVPEERIIVEE